MIRESKLSRKRQGGRSNGFRNLKTITEEKGDGLLNGLISINPPAVQVVPRSALALENINLQPYNEVRVRNRTK